MIILRGNSLFNQVIYDYQRTSLYDTTTRGVSKGGIIVGRPVVSTTSRTTNRLAVQRSQLLEWQTKLTPEVYDRLVAWVIERNTETTEGNYVLDQEMFDYIITL